jgi:hypothetical protein
VNKYPDASEVMKLVIKVLSDTVSLAHCTPVHVGESESWQAIVNCAMQNGTNLCKVFKGKSLFRALYGVYTVTLSDLKFVIQNSAAKGPVGQTLQTPNGGINPEEFKEMKRRKRNTSTYDDSHRIEKTCSSAETCEIS